ncbi:hypothetical protein VNO78_18030 [Psophocarpus tetragonolobus]|uniref:Pentatricopeptide repeat-containing protein n=1 Tax=Psophocarpus tetragonolobus TaxID=3891 RepID=A0AAN9XLP2_PSOTE
MKIGGIEKLWYTKNEVRQMEAQLILRKLYPKSRMAEKLIRACQSNGLLNSALVLFTRVLPQEHAKVYTLNSLMRAFCESEAQSEAPVLIYSHMLRRSLLPNKFSFPPLFKSLSQSHVSLAQCLYSHVIKLGHQHDLYVLNALLHLYASSCQLALCRRLFDHMPHRDVVSWTVLIAAYNNVASYHLALLVFEHLHYAGFLPTRVTIITALHASAHSPNIQMGLWIHSFIQRHAWELDLILGTSLIHMYSNCGRLQEALSVFCLMKHRNVYTWNALLKGFALAKSGHQAISCFNIMDKDGVRPDQVTFLALLSACSHSGLVDQARHFFNLLLHSKYGFCANVKHYACMVDVLARSGLLTEAVELMGRMPFQPTKAMWGSLLLASKAQPDFQLGLLAARNLIQLDPDNTAYYVHLSNLYAAMGRWSHVEKVRGIIKDRHLTKDLGSSSVEVEHQSHVSQLFA